MAQMFNIDRFNHKNYLSVGDIELEPLYWVGVLSFTMPPTACFWWAWPRTDRLCLSMPQVMFSLFTVICGVWFGFVYKQREHAQRIHYLMGVLCAFKALTVLSQAIMTHNISRVRRRC